MKVFLILIISLMSVGISYGQQYPEDSGFTNKAEARNILKDTVKIGKWMEYMDSAMHITLDTNAPYYSLTVYKDGKPSGIFRGYYRNGNLYFQCAIVNGQKNGVGRKYYQNGNVKSEIPYDKGKVV